MAWTCDGGDGCSGMQEARIGKIADELFGESQLRTSGVLCGFVC